MKARLAMAAMLLLAGSALAGCLGGTPGDGGSPDTGSGPDDAGTDPASGTHTHGTDDGATTVTVEQQEGRTVYWVLPGPRELDPQVFGNASQPRTTGTWQVQAAQGTPAESLLEDLPFLVGVPPDARTTRDDGSQVLETPTLFSDKARITSGTLHVAYTDRQPLDLPGKPGDTDDTATVEGTRFTDPAGNTYRIEVDHVVQPPIPGYRTGGGVITSSVHHGSTGTGSPLMPQVFTYGAFWAVGNVYVNGELADEHKVIHFMTTETVRNADYELAHEADTPLAPSNTPTGQVHHTHGVVLPITATPNGPMFDPVNTSFTLPNGRDQPFIHIMFEEDTITDGPFAEWTWPAEGGGGGGTGDVGTDASAVDQVVHVEGTEWSFDPANIAVEQGSTVEVVFHNNGSNSHNWGSDALGVRTSTVGPGETASVTFTADEAGAFPVEAWCSVPGHREAGMEGTITVQ